MSQPPATEAVPRCPSCDALLQRGARFCTACSTRVCPLCGRAVAADGGFCNYCGLDQRVPLGPRSAGPPPKVEGQRMPGWVIPVTSLIVVLIFAVATLIVRDIKGDVTGGPTSFQNVAGMLSTKPVLHEADGVGSTDTDLFAVEGRVQLCWELDGEPPSGKGAPSASFVLQDAGAARPGVAIRNKRGDGCFFTTLPAGRYYIKVNTPEWTRWRLTVREG